MKEKKYHTRTACVLIFFLEYKTFNDNIDICIQWIFIEEFTKHGTNRLNCFFSFRFVFSWILLLLLLFLAQIYLRINTDPSDLAAILCLNVYCFVLCSDVSAILFFFFSTMRECPPCLKHTHTQFSISLAHCFAFLVALCLLHICAHFICEPIEGASYQWVYIALLCFTFIWMGIDI